MGSTSGCMVFNIDKWNNEFSEYPVTRMSDKGK